MTTTFDQTRVRRSTYQQPRTEPAYAQPIETPTIRSTPMSNHSYSMPAASANTGGWVVFTYASFLMAGVMMGIGIWALPGEFWAKGYMMMAAVFLVGSTFTLAKTVRDEHESKRFANRLDEAKTEKLLMEINRG